MANGKTQRQCVSFLWGIATLIILISLALALCACGGSDDEEETTSSTTPRLTATVSTTTPEVTTTSTPEPTTTTTSEPTPTASTTTPETTTQTPTPTEDPNDPGVALKGMLNSLVVLFAQIGGQWEAYAGPNTVPLTMLQQGQVYWFYTTTDVAPTWSALPIYKGWNNVVWMGDSSAGATALSGYEATVLFVLSHDIPSGKTYLYQSPKVTALSVLQPGQTYQTFLQEPGNPMGQPSKYTH